MAAPGWLIYVVKGERGLAGPLVTSIVLAGNLLLTWAAPAWKVQAVRQLQRVVVNPPIRLLLDLGVLPFGLALLETTGRSSGRPRRTPVGNGRVGDTFWIIAEHGLRANYVRNIEAEPRVRVKLRRRLRSVWHDGIATVLTDDDPYARQLELCRHRPIRLINATMVRVMSAQPVTVRVDLVVPESAA